MATPPGLIVTVLYPRSSDLKFNLNYYLSHHIPLATKIWTPHGLLGVTVGETLAESTEFAYTITTQWKDLEAWEAAQRDQTGLKELMSDVPKFTNAEPIFVVAKVVSKE
ncbi:hypothetical protein BDV95DRAFT_659808 [Massariosphaeria phaeospora]|uniref:EthD domain-containing protein n=1 Tax=Massariosphaeria phaeospora TaxID=100035 RepID=A0A7C8MCY0_9PLEO|nr:hypothetical protein BDV95DRAFT_659808 [Massariosphaeria phaeospora]